MAEQTPQATAVDATVADAAANSAAIAASTASTAAQSAIANAQVVAAEAEVQAAERTARIAADTEERLIKWREEINQSLMNSHSESQQAIQSLKAETGTLAAALAKTQEALQALLTPPKQSAEIVATVTPAATNSQDGGEGARQEAKTTPAKRKLVRI
jgi:FtsZ-binding cell division protein ZapB